MISWKYFLIGLYKNKDDALVYSLYHSTLLDWNKIMQLSTQPGLTVFHKKISCDATCTFEAKPLERNIFLLLIIIIIQFICLS